MTRQLATALLACLCLTTFALAQDAPASAPATTQPASAPAAKTHGILLFQASDFGPADVAKALIGPAGQTPARVVVYLNEDPAQVRSMFPSVPEKGQDVRYATYAAAETFLDDAIKTAQGETLITLRTTKKRLVKGLAQLEASNALQPIDEVPPAARKILEDLEAAGDTFTTLQADVTYKVANRLTGDEEVRTGTVAFQQKTDTSTAKFRISFLTLQLPPGQATKNEVDYIFDGAWLTIAKHALKQLNRIQVAAEGERVEALKIGQGPFPVPFGQKAEDVIAIAEPSTRDLREGEPKGTKYLRLIPRREKADSVNFTSLEMWISEANHLPIKIVAKDASRNVTTVEFTNIRTQTKLQPALFTFDKPAGWTSTVEPMSKQQ